MNAGTSSHYDYEFDPADDSSTAARICRLVGRDRKVLELGCAAGAMTVVLARHYGCQVTGVEMNAEAAAHAARYAETVHVASLEDPAWAEPLAGRQFDTVLAADVLEHLHDPAACLRQLHQFLPEDGRIVVSVPNIAHGGVIASLLCGEFEYRDVGLLDRTHVHFFTPATLGRMLHANGFVVEHETAAVTGAWHPEFSSLWARLPAPFQRWLERGPSARAYQAIMVARRSAAAVDYAQAAAADAHEQWLGELPALFRDDEALREARAAVERGGEERARLAARLQEADAKLQEAEARLQDTETRLRLMQSSASWRVTAPLRACMRLLRGG